jgi:hypothetical protein
MELTRTMDLPSTEVISTIEAWRDGTLSDAEMRLWTINNYFPLHQRVAPNEPEHVALAIGIVLNEFEHAQAPWECPDFCVIEPYFREGGWYGDQERGGGRAA